MKGDSPIDTGSIPAVESVGTRSSMSAINEELAEEEYDVEAIIHHDMVKGTPYYRVKWKNWPENTWEPIGRLGKWKHLIDDFHRPCEGPRKNRTQRKWT